MKSVEETDEVESTLQKQTRLCNVSSSGVCSGQGPLRGSDANV